MKMALSLKNKGKRYFVLKAIFEKILLGKGYPTTVETFKLNLNNDRKMNFILGCANGIILLLDYSSNVY